MTSEKKNNVISRYIMATWRHWTISVGLVCALLLLSLEASRNIFPFLVMGTALLLGVMIYSRRHVKNQGMAIPYVITISLAIESLVLLSFNMTVHITDIYEITGQPVNDDLPFIVQLSLAPIIAIVSGTFILRRLGRGRFFRSDTGRSDVSLMQRMVWQETRYQTRVLFMLNLMLSVVGWVYAYYRFHSTSINRPDKFFFLWLPIIVYLLSLLSLGFRALSLWAFYSQNDPAMMLSSHRSAILRFLILADDKIYLTKRQLDVKQNAPVYYDTPVRLRTNFTKNYEEVNAESLFKKFTGIESGIKSFKYMFDGLGHGMDTIIYHVLCVLDKTDDVDDSRIRGGEWFTLDALRRLDRAHKLSAELSSELVHIYTVAMAWKSYDIEGNRRYAIKNYRPTYRLCDMPQWDVDYNDNRWLQVARLNADKPFFKLRRLLNKVRDGLLAGI